MIFSSLFKFSFFFPTFKFYFIFPPSNSGVSILPVYWLFFPLPNIWHWYSPVYILSVSLLSSIFPFALFPLFPFYLLSDRLSFVPPVFLLNWFPLCEMGRIQTLAPNLNVSRLNFINSYYFMYCMVELPELQMWNISSYFWLS